jgi:hypothetical protein
MNDSKKKRNNFSKSVKIYISIILSHERHFTVTFSPGNLMNLFEPHFGQIGHARAGSMNIQL